MRYVAPFAELVSVETVSVILTSGVAESSSAEETTTQAPSCGTQLPMGEEE